MNRYKAHKVVEAFKITKIDLPSAESTTRLLGDSDIAVVNYVYINKHRPQVGGYYVRYADGYESWSPAEAFEEGYSKIEDG